MIKKITTGEDCEYVKFILFPHFLLIHASTRNIKAGHKVIIIANAVAAYSHCISADRGKKSSNKHHTMQLKQNQCTAQAFVDHLIPC